VRYQCASVLGYISKVSAHLVSSILKTNTDSWKHYRANQFTYRWGDDDVARGSKIYEVMIIIPNLVYPSLSFNILTLSCGLSHPLVITNTLHIHLFDTIYSDYSYRHHGNHRAPQEVQGRHLR